MIYLCGNCNTPNKRERLGIYYDQQDNKVSFFCPKCNFNEFEIFDGVLELFEEWDGYIRDYHEYPLPTKTIKEPFKDSLTMLAKNIYHLIDQFVQSEPERPGENPSLTELEMEIELKEEEIEEWVEFFKSQLDKLVESKLY